MLPQFIYKTNVTISTTISSTPTRALPTSDKEENFILNDFGASLIINNEKEQKIPRSINVLIESYEQVQIKFENKLPNSTTLKVIPSVKLVTSINFANNKSINLNEIIPR